MLRAFVGESVRTSHGMIRTPRTTLRGVAMSQLRRDWILLAGLIVGTTACSGVSDGDGESEQALKPQPPKTTASEETFTTFESGQVRPLAVSPNGLYLYAVNTPDNRLEIFRIAGRELFNVASISVGLEPVAVAARSDREVWVV